MKNEKIQAEIEKVKSNKFLPDNIKAIKIKQLESQLDKEPAKQEVKPKQVNPPAKQKPKTTHKYKGKTVKELDEKDCDDLLRETKERRAKAAKSEKKSKSRPIIEKVTAPIVKSVKKAIENISAADLKDNPTELSRIDKAIEATKRFMMELKTILGEDFDKDTVEDEMKELHALAKELNKKYGADKSSEEKDTLPKDTQEQVNLGKVTYRGLGANKPDETKIKVHGKEYIISKEKFKELGGIQKIKFSAPYRKG